MSLASIYNVPDETEDLSQWAFAHMANHRDIIRIIFEVTGIALPEFQLDPFDPANSNTWERTHQTMHQQMNQVLGIDGNNLLGVNWQDKNRRSAWIFLQASEHRQACNILGLG